MLAGTTIVTHKLEEMQELDPRLIHASEEGKIILVLGAGASKNIDDEKPDWRKLAQALVEEYEQENLYPEAVEKCKSFLDNGDSSDYATLFTTLEKANKTAFWRIIRTKIYSLPKKEKLGLSHILAYLNPLLIITTNWDRLLDSLQGYENINWKDNFRDKNDTEDDCLYLSFAERFDQKHPSVLFLHGHISRLDTVLITTDQYEKLYVITKSEDKPAAINRFRPEFQYAPDLKEIFSQTDVEVIFFGMNPTNSEFPEIVSSLFGDVKRRIHILAPITEEELPKTIKQDIVLMRYPSDRHELALDFLVRLPPRKLDDETKKQYQVFSTFQRREYLLAQGGLEKNALSIKYCTENFTNVFGDDPYLEKTAREYAQKVWKSKESGSRFRNVEEFTHDILNGMKGRRDNLYQMIREQKIKRIYVLFKKNPRNIKDDELLRIKEASTLCEKHQVQLIVRWFLLEEHEDLQDAWPFKDPSMALIVGNKGSDFTVALCHASQANDSSPVRFQWVHKDTVFSTNRLGWFTRAWDLAQDYDIPS